jgi:site-specific recombinase XerD
MLSPSFPTPLLSISKGYAVILRPLPTFDVGYNLSDESCNLTASNDWEALLEFVNEYRDSEKTFRSYASEIERLCLWLSEIQCAPLSGLKRSDLADYYLFLASPPNYWCGASAKKFKRDGSINPAWRPFKRSLEGHDGLSVTTISRVKKIILSLFTYLVDQGYLMGNPATVRRTKGQRGAKAKKSIERLLQPHETLFVEDVLQQQVRVYQRLGNSKDHFKALRRYYAFELFLHTGMRISEPVAYTMGDINITGMGEQKVYTLDVSGKGDLDNETRAITLGKPFIEILKHYRMALNHAIKNPEWKDISPLPSFNENVPLIPDVSGLKAIGERQISTLFIEIRNTVIAAVDAMLSQFQGSDEDKNDLLRMRSVLENFTCHWMRHTHATYFLELTGDLKATQERLGHADLSTTQIYVHVLNSTKERIADKYDPSAMMDLL